MMATTGLKTLRNTSKAKVMSKKTLSRMNEPSKKRGRPRENKELYATVLRLPMPLGRKLKQAAKANDVSINSYVETALNVVLSS